MTRDAVGTGTVDLHPLLVPVAARYLRRLDALLAAAGLHAIEVELAERTLLERRLRPDMPTLRMHARVAMEFPFRALDGLLDVTPHRAPVDMSSLIGLRKSIDERMDVLERLRPPSLTVRADRRLRDRAGDAEVDATASDFVSLYVLPNFFFHVTAVYLTCRLLDVPIGKADFDGFHAYSASAVIE